MEKTPPPENVYFELQAEVDFTKHLGDIDATKELLALCPITPASVVLDVGCGVGITPAYIAKTYGCRVVGIDIHEQMVRRANARAAREGVADLVECRVADVHGLPFEDGAFDVVMAESVIALVEDQHGALRECVRVTKPGGYVGITEATWLKEPTPELLAYLTSHVSPNMCVRDRDSWVQLLAESGLNDIEARTHAVTARSEFSARVRRIGCGYMLKIWYRVLALSIRRRDYRAFLKEALSEPKELRAYWGYGIYVGRK